MLCCYSQNILAGGIINLISDAMSYLNSRMLTVFPEGRSLRTKLKSPIYILPSVPEAMATGAKSLLVWDGPLQVVQETLLWCPLPMTVEIIGGCWEMNIFSPFPLWTIPSRKHTQHVYRVHTHIYIMASTILLSPVGLEHN